RGGQGPFRSRRVRGTGDHRPGLGEGVDLALVILGRSQGRAVVEIGAAIPGAVPGVGFQRRPQTLGPLPAPRRPRRVAASLGELCERLQHGDEEPAVPDALTLAVGAYPVHAIVPVARAHQRQAVRPQLVAVLQGADAVFVNGPTLLAHARQVVVLLL